MLIAVGKVRAPHGLKGHIKVEALSGDPGVLQGLGHIFIGSSPESAVERRIEGLKGIVGAGAILKLEGVDSPEDADCMRTSFLYLEEDELPKLPEDTFYSYKLVGMKVLSTDGRNLGEVVRVDSYPANDCLAVIGGDGREFLVPAVKDIVKSVDEACGTITVEDRTGLR